MTGRPKYFVPIFFAVLLMISLCSDAAFALGQERYIAETYMQGDFKLVDMGVVAAIYVDSKNDYPGVVRAVNDLQADIQNVTRKNPTVDSNLTQISSNSVIIGTIGRNSVIDRLIDEGKLDVSGIQGKWESFVIQVVPNPLEGVEISLVIAGSDKRGTIYGIYDLSEQIGVSPWYWWADVAPRHRDTLIVRRGTYKQGEPSVKYRGIFINDEENLAEWAMHTYEGRYIGPKTYRKIFELLLRLKANYLWPAMHGISEGFNNDPQNARLADEYGIVMGSTHCDMLLRNNDNEWSTWVKNFKALKGYEPIYDYTLYPNEILQYWEESVIRNKNYEVQWTIGMRGLHDSPLVTEKAKTTQERVAVMERIFADQRNLLKKHVNSDLTKVFQVFVPYKEVLDLYNAGLKVPDDVTVMWVDDNHGYIRRLPNAQERARSGGHGIYYHISYWGPGSQSYLWLNTIPPALIYEEMSKAYEHDVRKVWVVNVGDIKPAEIGIEFFLNYAWNVDAWNKDNVNDFLAEWAAREFGEEYKDRIADIMVKYFQYNYTRKPEHLNVEGLFSHTRYGDEAQRRVAEFRELYEEAERIYNEIPSELRDAYYQLVLYKVKSTYLMNEEYYYVNRSNMASDQGRVSSANNFVEIIKETRAAKSAEITYYNKTLSGGKWDRIMDPENYPPPIIPSLPGSVEIILGPPKMGVIVEGDEREEESPELKFSAYTKQRRFIDIFNKGAESFEWNAASDQPWLKLNKTYGTVIDEERIWVGIDWDMISQGESVGTITINGTSIRKRIRVSVSNLAAPSISEIDGYLEADGHVSMEAEHYHDLIERSGASWECIKGLGRVCGDVMRAYPTDAGSITSNIRNSSPELQYRIYFTSSGKFPVEVYRIPTLNAKGGVRYAIGIDDGEPVIVDGPVDEWKGTWELNLFDAIEKRTVELTVTEPGYHTLKLWMVDAGVVIDKIVIYTDGKRDSYFGPLESYNSVYNRIIEDTPYAELPRPEPEPQEISLTTPWGAGVFLESGGELSIEAEAAYENSCYAFVTGRSGMTWKLCEGFSEYAMRLPDEKEYWTNTGSVNQLNPELTYRINFSTSGNYDAWLLVRIVDDASDSVFIGLDGKYKIMRNGMPTNSGKWAWQKIGTINGISKGLHSLNIWGREDGISIDKIYLTKGGQTPSGRGPQPSQRGESDTQPPTGSIKINNNDQYAASPNISLTLDASDNNGTVASMRLKNEDEAWSEESWQAYSKDKTWTLSQGDGMKRVYVQYRDAAGNTSDIYSAGVILDTQPPFGRMSIGAVYGSDDGNSDVGNNGSNDGSGGSSADGSEGSSNDGSEGSSNDRSEGPSGTYGSLSGDRYVNSRDVILILDAWDGIDGVKSMRIRNEGEGWGGPEAGWEPYARIREWILPAGDALKRVYVQYRDAAGNTSPEYYSSVTLDTIPPSSGSITINSGATTTGSLNVTLSLHAFDQESGIARMRLRNDDGLWSLWEPYRVSREWSLSPGEGVKRVSIQFIDRAGNLSEIYSAEITALGLTVPAVTGLKAEADFDGVNLSWQNPTGNWSGTRVIRREGGTPPSSPEDGVTVYDGTSRSYRDAGLESGVYSYAVYNYLEVEGEGLRYSEAAVIGNITVPDPNQDKVILQATPEKGHPFKAFHTAENLRNDPYTLWDGETLSIGVGEGGRATDLWLCYPGLIGPNEGQLPFGSHIERAKLVLKVKEVAGDKESPRRLKVYRITDPDNLGSPWFGSEDGMYKGLDFTHRDHRRGVDIPWREGSVNIMGLFDEAVDPADTIEFIPSVYEEYGYELVQFDITQAFRDWLEGEENQGLFITIDGVWSSGDMIEFHGVGAPNPGDRPQIAVVYSDSPLTQPEPVTDLLAEPGYEEISLTWSNPSYGVAGMKILRKEGSVPFDPYDGEVVYDGDGDIYSSKVSWTDSGLTDGASYYYAVYTYDNMRTYSSKAWVKVIPGAPSRPELHGLTEGDGYLDLDWSEAEGADYYRVYRRDESGGVGAGAGSEAGSGAGAGAYPDEMLLAVTSETSYRDTNLDNRSYTYWVTAVNSLGEGQRSRERSESVASVRTAPSNTPLLTTSWLSDNGIKLEWIYQSDRESRFVIERQSLTAGGWSVWEAIGETSFMVTVYIDTETEPGLFYRYRVKAVNDAGFSPYSRDLMITGRDVLPAPEDVKWQVISAYQVNLGWSDLARDEMGYIVEVLDESLNSLLEIRLPADSNYCRVMGFQPGIGYRFRVWAYNNDGESAAVVTDVIRTAENPVQGLL